MNLYSGPKFDITDPYPKVMNAAMVAMTYGFGLPALFPLTRMYLITMYVLSML